MRNETIIFGTVTFLVGAVVGYIACSAMNRKKDEEKNSQMEKSEEVSEEKPVMESTETPKTEADYKDYTAKVSELKYTNDLSEEDEEETEEVNKEYDDFLKKKKRSIYILGKNDVDDDYPDVYYEPMAVYYFTQDKILATESGDVLDIEETLGKDMTRIGWYDNDETDVWVRNCVKEIDYHVYKNFTGYEDFFGDEVPEVDEEVW